MPVEIDGFAVLGAIIAHPNLFGSLKAEATKTAKAFVTKALKEKTLTAASLAATNEAIGAEAFGLIVDGLSPADIKSVLTKVDGANDAVKLAGASDQRQHLHALARGTATPAVKAPVVKPASRAGKAPSAPKPALERSGNSKAMRAKNKVKA